MYNLSAKRHYLINSFTGYENEYSIIVRDIEVNENTLVLDLRVNHTGDTISRYNMIAATVTYNLVNDTYTIKALGKGSRKHSYEIKHTVTLVIDHLVKQANDIYKGDISDSISLTVDHYCTLIQEAGATTAQSNQMYYDINHTYNTVQEAYEGFNSIMDTFIPAEERLLNDKKITNLELLQLLNENNINISYSLEKWCIDKLDTVQYGCISARGRERHDELFNIINELIEIIESKSNFDPIITEEVNNSHQLDLQFFSTQQPETFHLYKNTFTSYSDAYNYALKYSIPTTMIISSLHPTLTNERLQQLEHEYVFSKSNMSYTDMKEYFTYIDSLQSSYDTDERYYKLKSMIQRYEYKQQSKLATENEQQRLSIEGSRLLVFMKEHGLQLSIKESTQWYYYKGVHVYSFHHCSVEQYHNDMLNLFNEYFPEYTDEYNNSSIHYYKGNEYTSLSMDHYPIGWISYNNNTQIAVFNRQLSNEELAQYNLIETVQQTA